MSIPCTVSDFLSTSASEECYPSATSTIIHDLRHSVARSSRIQED